MRKYEYILTDLHGIEDHTVNQTFRFEDTGDLDKNDEICQQIARRHVISEGYSSRYDTWITGGFVIVCVVWRKIDRIDYEKVSEKFEVEA